MRTCVEECHCDRCDVKTTVLPGTVPVGWWEFTLPDPGCSTLLADRPVLACSKACADFLVTRRMEHIEAKVRRGMQE